jgi:hypothetical protein
MALLALHSPHGGIFSNMPVRIRSSRHGSRHRPAGAVTLWLSRNDPACPRRAVRSFQAPVACPTRTACGSRFSRIATGSTPYPNHVRASESAHKKEEPLSLNDRFSRHFVQLKIDGSITIYIAGKHGHIPIHEKSPVKHDSNIIGPNRNIFESAGCRLARIDAP